MYTIVLMTALGTGVDLPDCGRRRHGCCGGDCYGSCGGCWGGCHGCHGGCYGGCWGSGYARGDYGWGAYAQSSYIAPYGYANTRYVPYNGQYASGYYQPAGGNMATTVPTTDGNMRRASYDEPAPAGSPTNSSTMRAPNQSEPGIFQASANIQGSAEVPATIIVSLPAEARLKIAEQPMQSSSATRSFVSPPLPRGKTFVYTLKAEMPGEFGAVTTSRDVEVRAGEITRISLTFPSTRSAE